MPVTDLSLDQLSKQHPELASVIYQKAEREIQSNYQRQLELLKRKNNNLESEIELLRSKGRFDRDQFVIEIKKENILLIREYEGRIADKITEINLLKKELARERLRVSDKSGELVLKQKVHHLTTLNENLEHENGLLKHQIGGFEIRQHALESDKDAALSLAHQSYREKLKSVSMDLVILRSQNQSQEERIKELEQMLNEAHNQSENNTFQQLYKNEKAHNDKLTTLLKNQGVDLRQTTRNSSALRTVAAKISTVLEKEQVVSDSQENLLLQNFLMALELHRMSMVTGNSINHH